MYTQKKYHNEDVEQYIANPKAAQKQAALFGEKCIPVGINNTFMPLEKDNPDNLEMAQYNIRDRFGYLSEDDNDNNEPE